MNRDLARRALQKVPVLYLCRAAVVPAHAPDEQPKGGARQHRGHADIREAEEVRRPRSQSVTLKRGQNIQVPPEGASTERRPMNCDIARRVMPKVPALRLRRTGLIGQQPAAQLPWAWRNTSSCTHCPEPLDTNLPSIEEIEAELSREEDER